MVSATKVEHVSAAITARAIALRYLGLERLPSGRFRRVKRTAGIEGERGLAATPT
jgi:hypothetical protein